MGGSNGELQDLTDRLVGRTKAYGMEVSAEKSKIMTNSTNNISADFSMNGQRLEDVTTFNTWEQPCAKMEPAQLQVHNVIASALAALARLNSIWRCNTSNFTSKLNL